MAGEEQKKEIERWTWKDTLDRLHHIDEVINTIVSCGIALAVGIFGAIGGLLALILSGSTSGHAAVVQGALLAVVIGGSVIILFLAWGLARQEWIRQWYFSLFPVASNNIGNSNQNLPPLIPPMCIDDLIWLDGDIPNKYWMEEPKPDPIKRCKRKYICWLGSKSPGYCVTWCGILFLTGIGGIIGGIILLMCILNG